MHPLTEGRRSFLPHSVSPVGSIRSPYALWIVAAVLLSGCYHTKVTTGLTPSSQVVEIPFAHSFVYGLVPPNEVRGAEQCPSGVAIVESEISFVNGLVAALTFSIYTPMHIKVTCAAAGAPGRRSQVDAGAAIGVDADPDAPQTAEGDFLDRVGKAADRAVRTGQPVYLDVTGR